MTEQAREARIDVAGERRLGVVAERGDARECVDDHGLLHVQTGAGQTRALVVGDDHDEAVARDHRRELAVVLLVDLGALQHQRDRERAVGIGPVDVGGILEHGQIARVRRAHGVQGRGIR